MIDGEFLLETMHGEWYPNHPLGKHMLLIVLFVKARGENQYTVTEYSINHFFQACFSKRLKKKTIVLLTILMLLRS